MRRLRSRRTLVAGSVLVLGLAVVAAIVLLPAAPEPPPITPDLEPLALDGQIADADLAHDSRSDLYRVPFGAVPAGTVVTLRLRAAAGDLSEASVRVYDALAENQVLVPMRVVARDATAGSHGFDYWQAELHTTRIPTVLYYRFIARDGSATRYVEDDFAFDGGPGVVLGESVDASWQIVTYQPDFATPEWTHGATAYQIFPDRFANGDPSNDPSPDAVPGDSGQERYRYGDVYGNPIRVMDWETDLPEGYCRAYQSPAERCTEGPLGRDFYGGDLAGISEHLPELAELGVTILYLNPIFAAPSNHRYDTSDYFAIDPDLGTRAEFDALLERAHELGIRVVLDGVFNHTSSDSPFFDRAHRFVEVGACESADSPFAAWYTLEPGPPAKCFDGQTYVDWFGFDTLPVLTEDFEVLGLISGEDGIVRDWLAVGIDGWRLDVMNEISHGFLRALRDAARAERPDAFILGEEWGDASAWLVGDQADGVMNYRFRRAVIGLVNGETGDLDGRIEGLTPSRFASTMEGLREDYPAPAWNSLLNLVDSHDTTRILWTLTPGADNREEKEDPEALAEGKAKLRLVAALQLTWPGIAGIYYGDEVGLTGHDDPDDRRPYPWSEEDSELRGWYARLANLRRDHESLRTGDLRFLATDDEAGLLAYLRRTDAEAAVVAVNLSDEPRRLEIDLTDALPAGIGLEMALGEAEHQLDGRSLVLSMPARGVALLLTPEGADLRPPAAPTDLGASAETGTVHLSWHPVDGAAGYTVWRSVVSGGGYVAVGDTDQTAFTDRAARNGVRHHYVVTARDETGNIGPRSDEVEALPQVVIADARLDAPESIVQPLSAVEPGTPIRALVWVDGHSAAEGPTVGVTAQLGFGPVGSDPDDPGAGWSWTAMRYDGEASGADRLTGTVRPEEAGSFHVALRVSTDGGGSWQVADRGGIGYDGGRAVLLEAQPGPDSDPPPPPGRAAAAVVSDSAVTLVWQPVSAADLYRYEVLRRDAPGEPFLLVGTATEPTFTDVTVRPGGSYVYVVLAVDAGFNRSAPSDEVAAAAESRQVEVTFTLTVPDYTPAADTIYLAGDFQGWDPGATPMSRMDAVTWRISLIFAEGTEPQYKYTRGTWEAVEKDDACGEIPNRTFAVVFGTDGTQQLVDKVGKWRDIDNCG